MDLTYMDHLLTRRLVNLPRVMLRHMAYAIPVPTHELPYGDWLTMMFEAYNVSLDDKRGEEPKSYDYFDETFLSMCQLKRENGVWWLGIGEHRRRDEEENAEVNNNDAPAENVEKYYDAVDEERPDDVDVQVLDVVAPAPSSVQQKAKITSGVDLSDPFGSLPDSDFMKLQAEFDRARAERLQAELDHARAENAKLQALL
ncbi:hypothetical protein Dimus_024856 [Dionaea muscipula]